MSFYRKAIIVNSAAIICLAIGVIQAAILSRILGPNGIGQYTLIITTLTLTATLSSIGLPKAFLYYSKKNPHLRNQYFGISFWTLLLLGFIGGSFLSILLLIYPKFFGPLSTTVIGGLWIYIIIVQQRALVRNYLLAGVK